ncbi:MAG: zinc-ribbon domain-containing protein [Clostridia bacterium]|nr:zinc-ribbon domain-containing protein [Clostridia bacterium]
MITCTNCGRQIDERAAACPFCGTSVTAEQPEQPAYEQPTQPAYGQPVYAGGYAAPAPKKGKGLLFGLIGGGVGLLILIAVLCFVFCGSSYALEPGMTKADVKAALEEEGLYLEIDDVFLGYEGSVEDLGSAKVSCIFNEKGELKQVAIRADSNLLEKFLIEEVGDFEEIVYSSNGDDEEDAYRYDEDGVVCVYMPGLDYATFVFEEYLDDEDDGWRRNISYARSSRSR